ncbi:type II toxin-antitoxin system PemK/MazF family toxin [Cellulomonas sp. P24]|uniref:type II toxin-antitoxin system PemK/MazF family toxin n=1 Tax=Cellulomonas sp. P24 TaxID=2885206 RepID=UPI00216B5E08|nr:type II toxin-antitoxin system PemK/MazF family toxin [Cellulomonas sp. P24]MCR6494075.1 type II toxin-antitoxin system PemK/MazF family toxin [Cellulomonas sp. P24]
MTTARWTRRLGALVQRALRATRTTSRREPTPPRRDRTAARPPGDFVGTVRTSYAPRLDGDADPGEIVWTWVPFEEDPSRGKDRPVLVIGRDGPWLLGLMLSSKDHTATPRREPHPGPRWIDIGAGAWDARRRPSEVRLDRVLRIDPQAVRREGAIMDRAQFDLIARSRPGSRS